MTIGPRELESIHARPFSDCLLTHGREKLAETARAITERTEAQIDSNESRWSNAAELALAWFEAWQIIERSRELEDTEDQPLSKAADYRVKLLGTQGEAESLGALILQEFKAFRDALDELRECFHFAPFALPRCRDGWLSPFDRVEAFEPQTAEFGEWNTLIQTLRTELLALQFSQIGIVERTSQFWLKPKQRSKYAMAIQGSVLPQLDKIASDIASISSVKETQDELTRLVEQQYAEIEAWWAIERLKARFLPLGMFACIEDEIRLRDEIAC